MHKFNKLPKILYTLHKTILYENNWKGENCNLRYVFLKNRKSKKVLVVFSSFSTFNKPSRYSYFYSYRNVPCNILFILDNFGPGGKGAYYFRRKQRFFY